MSVEAGILASSTKIYYAVETEAGTKPTSWTNLPGVTTIPTLQEAPSSVDVTPVDVAKDGNTVYAMGLTDTGGSKDVSFNMTKTVISNWQTMETAYATAAATGKATWFRVAYPSEIGYAEEFTAQPSKLRFSGADGYNNPLVATASLTVSGQIQLTDISGE